jgi:hypothetical protein
MAGYNKYIIRAYWNVPRELATHENVFKMTLKTDTSSDNLDERIYDSTNVKLFNGTIYSLTLEVVGKTPVEASEYAFKMMKLYLRHINKEEEKL